MTTTPQQRHVELARQIASVARQNRWCRGTQLKEERLAKICGVSRSPIRTALSELDRLGLVERRPNQGVFLAVDASEIGRMEIDMPPSSEEKLYLQLIDDRISGVLPDYVKQAELFRHYNVGRDLLLRALNRMSEEGIIQKNPGQGWTFLPTLNSAQSQDASYDLRKILEPSSILLPTFQVDHTRLGQMHTDHTELLRRAEQGSWRRTWLFDLDASFHEMIADFSNNVFIIQNVRKQNRMRRLLEYRGYRDWRRIGEWCREHINIINALNDDAYFQAYEAMEAHIVNAKMNMKDI